MLAHSRVPEDIFTDLQYNSAINEDHCFAKMHSYWTRYVEEDVFHLLHLNSARRYFVGWHNLECFDVHTSAFQSIRFDYQFVAYTVPYIAGIICYYAHGLCEQLQLGST